MYEKYVTIQFPEWSATNERADVTWGKAALHRMKGWLPTDTSSKCLDLGCGAGGLLQVLRGAGYREISGVDLAPEAVGIARKHGLNVIHADVRQFLQENQGTYDLVCAFDLVEHFQKDELLDLLRLIWNRLNPLGTLIIQTPNARSPWSGDYRYSDLTHELILSPQSAENSLKLVGFGSIEVREVAPFVHGVTSAIRSGVWKLLWAGCGLWNLAETGTLQGGVFTRNMMVKANKGIGKYTVDLSIPQEELSA